MGKERRVLEVGHGRFWNGTSGHGLYSPGLEYDYIGVIFGNDLVRDAENKTWKSIPENSNDTQVKRKNPRLTQHLRHVYRVLMSRAHRGAYAYFMDKDTEERFRSALPD
jgi:DUF2075 family protein